MSAANRTTPFLFDTDFRRPQPSAEVLRAAAAHGLTVVPRGRGTKLSWGVAPTTADVLVDVSALDQVLDHAAGDLIAVTQAGARLSDVQEVVGRGGQRLALDETVPGSSIGGTLATNTSGPRRVATGTARDLLIGVTVVRADGVVRQVLVQGAAEVHVEQLQSAADRQHRQVPLERGRQEGELAVVARTVDAHGRVRLLAVQRGVDVGDLDAAVISGDGLGCQQYRDDEPRDESRERRDAVGFPRHTEGDADGEQDGEVVDDRTARALKEH